MLRCGVGCRARRAAAQERMPAAALQGMPTAEAPHGPRHQQQEPRARTESPTPTSPLARRGLNITIACPSSRPAQVAGRRVPGERVGGCAGDVLHPTAAACGNPWLPAPPRASKPRPAPHAGALPQAPSHLPVPLTHSARCGWHHRLPAGRALPAQQSHHPPPQAVCEEGGGGVHSRRSNWLASSAAQPEEVCAGNQPLPRRLASRSGLNQLRHARTQARKHAGPTHRSLREAKPKVASVHWFFSMAATPTSGYTCAVQG